MKKNVQSNNTSLQSVTDQSKVVRGKLNSTVSMNSIIDFDGSRKKVTAERRWDTLSQPKLFAPVTQPDLSAVKEPPKLGTQIGRATR